MKLLTFWAIKNVDHFPKTWEKQKQLLTDFQKKPKKVIVMFFVISCQQITFGRTPDAREHQTGDRQRKWIIGIISVKKDWSSIFYNFY